MFLKRLIEIFVCFNNNVLAEMQGYIVEGENVTIKKYPHSAFLDIFCSEENMPGWRCGSSIINQHFTLTAAHCLVDCQRRGFISVAVGHENKHKGVLSSAHRIKTHKKYQPDEFLADIGLVRLKTPFELGPKIQRVILMRNPPREKVAYIAGWGVVDEVKQTSTNWLKHAEQPLWSTEECQKILGRIPVGSICAGTKRGKDYVAGGDSGSALVIKGFIQIGIVSFKRPGITPSLSVYVNVTHYYDWIVNSTAAMFCAE